MEKESFEGERAEWKLQADNEINKITKRIDEYLTFESDNPNDNNARNAIRANFSNALKTFEENICSTIRKSLHKHYFEKELHEHLAQFDEVDDEAEMLSEQVRRNAARADARKEINAEKAKLRENEAEVKLDEYIRQFNKAINYKPCSDCHEMNLKKCLVMNEQEIDAYKNRTQYLISKKLNDEEFAEQFELIESSLLEMIAIAKNYRKLTGVAFSLMTPTEKKMHAENELNAHIQQFNKVINYRPCSFTHDGERNQCLSNYDRQVIQCRETIEFLIYKPIKFKQFDKELRAIFSPLVDIVNTAEKYRLLNDITHSKQTTKAKHSQDLLDRAKITIDGIKERFDVELNEIENPVLEELNKPFEDVRKSVEQKIAQHREKLKLDIMSMDDDAAIETNLKECVDALECDLKKLQEELQPYRDYQKEIFPIRERAEHNCVQLISRADNLKLLIINRDDARELNSKCHTEYYAKKIECAIRDHHKQTIDTKQLEAKLKELNDELNEIIDKAEHSISSQSYDELHQKLEEIKTQFNSRIALEPPSKRRSLHLAKLSVKFKNDLSSVLRNIKMKTLVARSTSDFMAEILQPFRLMLTEAEDLVLPLLNQQITDKRSELIAQFNNVLDFKSGAPGLMAKRTRMLSKFKKIQQSPFEQVALDIDDVVAGSTSNYTTKVLKPFISMVAKAEDLRKEHNDFVKSKEDEIIMKRYCEISTRFYQKLEEIKKQLNTTIDFETNDKSLSLSISNLRVKLENASSEAITAFAHKEKAKIDSDYMAEVLQPLTSILKEAEDLRGKHGDALLDQLDQEQSAKYAELKTKFNNEIDFECHDQNAIKKREKLRSRFLEASNAFLEKEEAFDEDELIAGSLSDMVHRTVRPFVILLREAEDLRFEYSRK